MSECDGKNRRADGSCCGGCSHGELDAKALGPEAVELDRLFREVNDGLVGALKSRALILQLLHEKGASDELKEKLDKVVSAQHPVLLQFVFGQEAEK